MPLPVNPALIGLKNEKTKMPSKPAVAASEPKETSTETSVSNMSDTQSEKVSVVESKAKEQSQHTEPKAKPVKSVSADKPKVARKSRSVQKQAETVLDGAPKRVSVPSSALDACRDILVQFESDVPESAKIGWGSVHDLHNSECVMFAIGMLVRTTDIDGMSERVKMRVQYAIDHSDSVSDLRSLGAQNHDELIKRLTRIEVAANAALQSSTLLVMERYGLTPGNITSATVPGGINFSPSGMGDAVRSCRQAARNRMNQERRPGGPPVR